MIIITPKLHSRLKTYKKNQILNLPEIDIKLDNKINIDDFLINYKSKNHNNQVMFETGFFNDAAHLDKNIFLNSSLNNPNIRNIVEDGIYKKPARYFLDKGLLQPKYFSKKLNQDIDWTGAVLICQIPIDASVLSAGGIRDYFHFVEEAAKYYGNKLYIKRHPYESVVIEQGREAKYNDRPYTEVLLEISKRYGCEIGKCSHSVIKSAEIILTYNSTFAVDACMYEKTVQQFAAGYFYKTGIVDYTDGKISKKLKKIDKDYTEKFLTFLMWKYCFSMKSPEDWIVSIFKTYNTSPELFPLPEEYSYANFLITNEK